MDGLNLMATRKIVVILVPNLTKVNNFDTILHYLAVVTVIQSHIYNQQVKVWSLYKNFINSL